MSTRVLILGKGFMGTRIHDRLLTQDTIISNIISKSDFDYIDVSRLAVEYFSDNPIPDIIINASGYTGIPNVDACELHKDECWNMNVAFPIDLHKFCQNTGITMIHISSGCIYDGYGDKPYTEDDTPNFGMFSDRSSFYSKTKHCAELFMQDPTDLYIFRIRIPFTCDNTSRNYLNKLLGYDNLISLQNSITSVEEFSDMITRMISTRDLYSIPTGIYNAVNPEPVCAKDVTSIMKEHGLENPSWNFIEIDDLNTVANRSNCIISCDKLKSIGYGFNNTKDSLKVAVKHLQDKIKHTV